MLSTWPAPARRVPSWPLPCFPYELANVVRQRMRREGLTLDDAMRLFNDFASFPVRLVAPPSLHADALAIADAYALGAVYDAHYIALAQHLGCDFWTDDRRLLRALAGRLPFVRWIGDYS